MDLEFVYLRKAPYRSRHSSCDLQAIRGIKILMKAISKIQLIPSQLTSIHADMCQVGEREVS